MNKLSETERQAGVLLLSQLKMFNEAVVYFEQHLDPAFGKSFDQCIERFIKDNNWAGKHNIEHQNDCWLAKPSWVIEGTDCKYWFEYCTSVSEGHDYALTVLTCTGTEQGYMGFEFKINTAHFGGARKVTSYTNTVSREHQEQLKKLGFKDQGKGNYFLPIIIDPKLLTECWEIYGEFPVEHEVFSPLKSTLETLLESTEILDAMFRDAI